ncbi:MAG: DUF2283 domain-containing protein [Tepidiformaceae bacterium]
MTVTYDELGDILYWDTVPTYAEQGTAAIGDGILARTNPTSGAVEGLEIWNFRRRAVIEGGLALPVMAAFWLQPGMIAAS